jgi:MerR family transcriptional regulator, heat shock protein HspR
VFGSGGLGGTENVPVFVISVAAQLAGMHAQTLRQYDRLGLVSPGRTAGGGRRYSLRDVEQLREVARLSARGVGLEGVRRILELETELDTLRARLAQTQADLDAALDALTERVAATHAAYRRELVPVRRSDALVVWRPTPRLRS